MELAYISNMHHLFKILSFLAISTSFTMAGTSLLPNHPQIQYGGRWLVTEKMAQADWPGVYLKVAFEGTGISLQAAGEVVLEALIDGESVGIFTLSEKTSVISLAKNLSSEKHVLTLVKRSESQSTSLRIFKLELSDNGKILNPPTKPQRRIEFIGDSYTVGYGMESAVREPGNYNEDSLLLATTNAYRNFGALIATSLGAEYQINAISGRGLARNINGILPDRTLPVMLQKTLLSDPASPNWDANQFHPQVIVIGLGINDFQGEGKPVDNVLFDQTYATLLEDLRSKHPGVQFILCATKVWPRDELKDRVKAVVQKEIDQGRADVQYFEYGSENQGLWFHPSTTDHQTIARSLRPIVAKAGRWMSR